MNGDDNSHNFQEVQLEGGEQPREGAAAERDTTSLGSGGGRGERVKQEISLLSPAQQHTAPPQNQNEGAEGSASKAARPEDLGIKTFVPSKPLPVPTPSREATLTQKLEQALGKMNKIEERMETCFEHNFCNNCKKGLLKNKLRFDLVILYCPLGNKYY